MPWNRASSERLRRLFLRGFSVMDIAEPLASFDEDRLSSEVLAFMQEQNYDMVGVRRDGLVCGYAHRDALTAGTSCGEHLQPFGPDDLVTEAASLAETIASLGINGRCFVSVLDGVAGIVTLEDLEKPPVRMYLFGMITILEMLVTKMIRERFPGDSWTHHVSEGRLQRARELHAERLRRQERVDLVDCLQYSDKGQILMREPEIRRELNIQSRKEGLRSIKELEALRNNLAHTQAIIASSWTRIVRFSGNLDSLLDYLGTTLEPEEGPTRLERG